MQGLRREKIFHHKLFFFSGLSVKETNIKMKKKQYKRKQTKGGKLQNPYTKSHTRKNKQTTPKVSIPTKGPSPSPNPIHTLLASRPKQ